MTATTRAIARDTYLSVWSTVTDSTPQKLASDIKLESVLFFKRIRTSLEDWSHYTYDTYSPRTIKTLEQEDKEKFLKVFTILQQALSEAKRDLKPLQDLLQQLLDQGMDEKAEDLVEVCIVKKIPLKPALVLIAFEKKCERFLEKLVEKNKFLNATLSQGQTLLHLACLHNMPAFLEQLLEKQLSARDEDDLGNTPFHYACQQGNHDLVYPLLTDGNASGIVNRPNKKGFTPLSFLCGTRNAELVRSLVEDWGAEISLNVPNNPFACAFKQRDKEVMIELYHLLVKTEHEEQVKEQLPRYVEDAVCEGCLPLVQGLIEACGADVNVKEINGLYSPHLISALKKGHDAIVTYLINVPGIDLEIPALVSIACKSNVNNETIRSLIKTKALSQEDIYHLIQRGLEFSELASYTVALTDVNALIENQATLLHIACQKGDESLFLFLMANQEIKVNVRDQEQRTPLHLVAENGNLAFAERLVKAGAALEAYDLKRNSPYHYAAGNDHRTIIELLHAADAEFDYNDAREYPLDIALNNEASRAAFFFLWKANPPHEKIHLKSPKLLYYACGPQEQIPEQEKAAIIKLLIDNLSDEMIESFFSQEHSPNNALALFSMAAAAKTDAVLHQLFEQFSKKISPAVFNAYVNRSQNENGDTLLHLALKAQFLVFAIELIERGADLSIQNNAGDTALTLAKNGNLSPILRHLWMKGLIEQSTLSNPEILFPSACRMDETKAEAVLDLLLNTKQDLSLLILEGKSLLLHACEHGLARLTRRLLAEIAFNNTPDPTGRLPLHWALESFDPAEHADIMKELIIRTDGMNVSNSEGKTALHLACDYYGELSIVELILKKKALINALDCFGRTPLAVVLDAVKWGDSEDQRKEAIVSALFAAGADPDIPDVDGFSPIVLAVENRLVQSAETLFQKIQDPLLARRKTRCGQSLLELACEKEMFKLAFALLSRGPDLRALPTIYLQELCFYGLKRNNPIIWDIFKQTDIEELSIQTTPLHQALLRGELEQAKEFLNRDLYINVVDHRGRLPLHVACALGLESSFIQALQYKTQNKTAEDLFGRKPIEYAFRSRKAVKCADFPLSKIKFEAAIALHSPVVFAADTVATPTLNRRLTLYNQLGMDAIVTDLEGNTPLHKACQYAHNREQVQFLLDKGQDPNADNALGNNALHIACIHGAKMEIVLALLAKIADKQAQNEKGESALDLAFEHFRADQFLAILKELHPNDTLQKHSYLWLIQNLSNLYLDTPRFIRCLDFILHLNLPNINLSLANYLMTNTHLFGFDQSDHDTFQGLLVGCLLPNTNKDWADLLNHDLAHFFSDEAFKELNHWLKKNKAAINIDETNVSAWSRLRKNTIQEKIRAWFTASHPNIQWTPSLAIAALGTLKKEGPFVAILEEVTVWVENTLAREITAINRIDSMFLSSFLWDEAPKLKEAIVEHLKTTIPTLLIKGKTFKSVSYENLMIYFFAHHIPTLEKLLPENDILDFDDDWDAYPD